MAFNVDGGGLKRSSSSIFSNSLLIEVSSFPEMIFDIGIFVEIAVISTTVDGAELLFFRSTSLLFFNRRRKKVTTETATVMTITFTATIMRMRRSIDVCDVCGVESRVVSVLESRVVSVLESRVVSVLELRVVSGVESPVASVAAKI